MKGRAAILNKLKQFRIGLGAHILDEGRDGMAVEVICPNETAYLQIIASWGAGWDHVSVSLPDRDPTWAEMAFVKGIFFRPEECAMQLHPPHSRYVNVHEHCLHLWRPQGAEIPQPPVVCV